jgi:hypothetical protein
MKFIIMQFSPRSVFLPFRSKCPPQLSVLKSPQSVLIPQGPSFAPIQNNWQKLQFCIFYGKGKSKVVPVLFKLNSTA